MGSFGVGPGISRTSLGAKFVQRFSKIIGGKLYGLVQC